jgi:molybdopterin-guanine dinucleotide biosynthesis protein A
MGGMLRRIRCGGRPMTVLVLAGGRGRRMRAEKARLAVGDRTLLEHVLGQVGPSFDEVLISVTPGQMLPPLSHAESSRPRRQASPSRSPASRLRVVPDETPGLGPIGGVLAGLRAARNDACAVVACDIPDVDLALLRSLARAAAKVDVAVPVGPSGLYEPLFAVYRRSVIPEIEALLGSGERSLLPLYSRLSTAVVRFADPGRIPNLNTRADYEAYLGSIAKGGRQPAPRREGGPGPGKRASGGTVKRRTPGKRSGPGGPKSKR